MWRCLRGLTLVVCLAIPEVALTADFRIQVTWQSTADRGDNGGTLFELYDTTQGTARLVGGAGFTGCYNTQHRTDREYLQFFVRNPQSLPPMAVERLPRPDADSTGYYPYTLDSVLYVINRGGPVQRHFRWEQAKSSWSAVTAHPPKIERIAGKLLTVTPERIDYDGQPLLLAPSGEGLGEHYFAHGALFVRHFPREKVEQVNRIEVHPWHPSRFPVLEAASPAQRLMLRTPGEFIYAYGQTDQALIACSNLGGVYRFENGTWTSLNEHVPNVSYQIYTALTHRKSLLFGQYPTGELFEYSGQRLQRLNGSPPVLAGVSRSAREAQSLAIYGGDLYCGVWPWAELWRKSPDQPQWSFAQRMFQHPSLTDKVNHPYETETQRVDPVYNLWGQRITGLVPWDSSLIITTSSKGGTPRDQKFAFLSQQQTADYGAIYRLTIPGELGVQLPCDSQPQQLEFSLHKQELSISRNGTVVAKKKMASAFVDRITANKLVLGQGVFGRSSGPIRLTQSTIPQQ